MVPSIESGTDWKPLYEAALLETDASKLCERVVAARTAILDRMEATLRNPDPIEQRAMNEALRNPRRLAEITTSKTAA